MRCFEDDLLTEQINEFGAHTRPELAFLMSILAAGDRVFDLGAHVGSYAIPLGRQVAPGNVVAAEARSAYYELLTSNVAANGLSSTVRPVNAILAPNGSTYVAAGDARNSMATRFVQRRFWQRRSDVPVRTLDGLASEYGIPVAIKIDIEGLELDVLECSRIVADTGPILYAEVSERHLGAYGRTVGELETFLRNLDYRLFRNVGDRNAAHDRFRVSELESLGEVQEGLFDVLDVRAGSARIKALTTRHI